MTDPRLPTYAGPVEAMTVEQAAARLACTKEHFVKVFPGPYVFIGEGETMKRVPAFALHDWMVERIRGKTALAEESPWDDFKDEDQGVQTRPGDKAA